MSRPGRSEEALLARRPGHDLPEAAANPIRRRGRRPGGVPGARRCSRVPRAAWLREETRGGHYRTDFPRPDDAWRRRVRVRLDDDGVLTVT